MHPGFKVAGVFACGTLGGLIFVKLTIPLPWLLGSMTACTLACLAGAPFEGPNKLRTIVLPVLGVMLGSNFNSTVLSEIHLWLETLGILCCFILILTIIGALALRISGVGNPATCFFSALPGGFSEMVLLLDDCHVNRRTVSLIHATRILITILVIPLWFQVFTDYQVPMSPVKEALATINIEDSLILIACAILGYVIAKKLRIPAAALLGPALISAIVHILDITAARPPNELLAIAQLVIGIIAGCRFSGVTAKEFFSSIIAGLFLAISMIISAALLSYFLANATSLSQEALWLAFAPGGLTEMTLMSLAMNVDVALVSIHHTVRIFFIVTIIPFAYKITKKYLA